MKTFSKIAISILGVLAVFAFVSTTNAQKAGATWYCNNITNVPNNYGQTCITGTNYLYGKGFISNGPHNNFTIWDTLIDKSTYHLGGSYVHSQNKCVGACDNVWVWAPRMGHSTTYTDVWNNWVDLSFAINSDPNQPDPGWNSPVVNW